ncbi:hypothetical protein GFS31_24750 [Leptolyngbya sp. BL0902]|nr:hypothetical protein GFS31_24750 [Leptolyngbya sp. BL0902]
MRFPEIYDPKELCRDVTNLGRWGNGDVEVGLENTAFSFFQIAGLHCLARR